VGTKIWRLIFLFTLVDDLPDELAGLHVVVGVLEHAAHHEGSRRGAVALQLLQGQEQLVVDEALQLLAGDAFGVGRPVAPAVLLGQRGAVVLNQQLPFKLAVIEDFEKKQPAERMMSWMDLMEPLMDMK